jgi:hypothetical protein
MSASTPVLRKLLESLTAAARAARLSDAAWARRAGVPKETLSRLRGRATCDLATLHSLASALDCELAVVPASESAGPDGRWPRRVDRAYEARVLDLLASGSQSLDAWRLLGPAFFVAGLAVTLASVSGFERRRYLALAERLHAGSTVPAVYQQWLDATPLPPSRLLPPLRAARENAA